MIPIAKQLDLNDLYVNKNWTELAQRAEIADHPDWTLEMAAVDLTARRFLASNPAIASLPEIVAKFADDLDKWVRLFLAGNPAIASFPDVAAKLAADEDFAVRRNLATNPEIVKFPEVAAKIAGDEFSLVRESLAANPALAKFPEIAAKLADDEDPKVRQIAKNTAISKSQSIPISPGSAHLQGLAKIL